MARPDRAALVDAGLTVGLGAVFLMSTAGATDAHPVDGLGWALLAANTLPLLVLHRIPLAVLLVFGCAYPTWASLEYPTHLLQSLPTLAALGVVGAAPRPLWWRAIGLLVPAEMMAAAISGVWDVISPPTARRLLRDLAASRPDQRPTPAALKVLTERELEVLRLVARGLSNRAVARQLVISELTAKTHVSRILTKLDLISRVHAVVFAYETGLITPGGD